MNIKLFKYRPRCSKCDHKMIYNEHLQTFFCPFCDPLYVKSVVTVKSGEHPAEIKLPDSISEKLTLGLTKNINNSKTDFTNGER